MTDLTNEPVSGLVERVRAALDFLYNWTDGKGRSECVSDGRAALAELQRRLERAEGERDAIGAALGEPCAECGHIDWRSDGYADRFLVAEALVGELREALWRARHELDQWVLADGTATYRVARAEDILDAALAKTERDGERGRS